MDAVPSAGEDFGSMQLGQIGQLPIEERCERILSFAEPDLHAAIQSLADIDEAIPAMLTTERLAWAVAFNVEGPEPREEATKEVQCYLKRWGPNKPWAPIWSDMNRLRQTSGSENSTTFLRELALSVACEMRDDWQPPSARPIDPGHAEKTQNEVFRILKPMVSRVVTRKLGDSIRVQSDLVEDVVSDTLLAVFIDFWSSTAVYRFTGVSRLSTLLYPIAQRRALDLIRREAAKPELVSIDETRPGENSLVDNRFARQLSVSPNQTKEIDAARFRRDLQDCMESLPSDWRAIFSLKHLEGGKSKDEAERRGVTQAAIAQQGRKAEREVRKCLKNKGW